MLIDIGLKISDINLVNVLDDADDLNHVELLNLVNYALIKDDYNNSDGRGVDIKSALNAAGVNPFNLLDIYKKGGHDCGDILILLL